ncbi:transmembrane amino acid transporter family protein [Striga asiatica]|uniref:Transmembrane amino acid transporter family protein n=1 Tax=Striga asiatica TaxID=4170 RepID=A0A5A7PR07_STRAF|nr:transmembrane amino acid transporter family protein [Striga asiatica]
MKKFGSEQSIYIDSEEEDEKVEANEAGNESDYSNYSSDNDDNGDHRQRKPSSLNPSWPQSYRRHTPEILPSLSKPLIEEEKSKEKRSSHYLLPPVHSRVKKVDEDGKVSDAHGLPISRQCSFGQAVLNVVACLFWVGLVDQVGFETKGSQTLNLSTLPVAVGLYGYCYSGHAVFPNIYTSMENPRQYPAVLLASFGICTVLYAAVAVMGYLMYGNSIQSQFTLNMPHDLVASKIALWTTVVNPFTKYPFSSLVMAFIGSFLTMLVTLILPCACYLSILRGKVSLFQGSMCVLIIGVGTVSSAIGTYSALAQIIENLS